MKLLRKISNWKTFGALLILYILFAVFVMSGMTGDGALKHQPLDLLFSYTPQEAYALIESYGNFRGRYAFMSMTADTIYPILYTLLFMVLIMQLCKVFWPKDLKKQWIALVPLLAFVFDILENASIITMLRSYPERHDTIAQMSSLCTSLKWLSVGLVFGIICVLLVMVVAKVVVKKTGTRKQ